MSGSLAVLLTSLFFDSSAQAITLQHVTIFQEKISLGNGEIAAAEIEANPEVIRYGLTSSTTANAFPTDEQFEAAFKLMGEFLDNSGYSWAISKDKLKPFADQIAIAVVAAGPKQEE